MPTAEQDEWVEWYAVYGRTGNLVAETNWRWTADEYASKVDGHVQDNSKWMPKQ